MIRRILDLTLGQAFYCLKHFTVNLIYVILRFWKIPKARRRLRGLKKQEWILYGIDLFFKTSFDYKPDKGDRRSWMITLCMNWDKTSGKFKGDCDDYLTMAKYLAKHAKLKTQSWSIFGQGKGHALCLIYTSDINVFIADNKKGANVRRFVSWKVNFPWASERIRRWY